MPVFDFVCPQCGNECNDVFVKAGNGLQCECGADMDKKLSAPNLGGMNNLGQSK